MQSGALVQNVVLVDSILQELVPEHHAIGCIFVLNKKAANVAASDAGVFLEQVKQVIMGGNAEQLRFVRHKVCDICRIFADHCKRSVLVFSEFTFLLSSALFGGLRCLRLLHPIHYGM